ncbi:nucleolar complex protein 2 [Tribolium castaneum]|uniref:Nucleolar complex protein 2 homolog-like Protein n=1 Tax=Tribolium castaneum TaxID=7070 RepID=D6WYX1_TRICA|nr:PREDICTED: nucleolar complex protein 2 homolog [Tribolium castaneum]EFA07851.1 Nucleolar complex protein 2 homolog-like Protein [Tribolium castaneum]|eukprot:XP_968623.1 PREDICTED: nucleolar complex protein 2 homolog [Tribolium castaneum]
MAKIKKKTITKRPQKAKKAKLNKTKKSEDYSSMSVDKFLDQDFEASASDEETNHDSVEESSGDEIQEHKAALSKLKDTDPEFYKFLQDNDKKLLEFNLSDEESDDEESAPHKPPEELEVASDESDFEDDSQVKETGTVTLKMLKSWENSIQSDKSNKTITTVMQAFHAALLRVSSEEGQEQSNFKVEGPAVFNGVIQLCVLHLGPALRRFLGLSDGSKQPPHKCKRFVKVRRVLKDYFMDLSKLLKGVTSANIQTVLLKHLHYLSPFMVSYPNITKTILKRLITIWGTAEEGVRVLAFLCILRITNGQKAKFLDTVLKSMYMTYVKNSKFVSVGSLACINFMRRSLVEMFALDAGVAYQHVFLYIRQLAIYLRNAITVNKKENIHAVYNWQFVNSLKLWGSFLSASYHKMQLAQLVYPLVQVCLGVLKLVPTAQYYPLRFHVVKILMDLSRDTGVFIPILPFILEVLSGYDFNKKHQKVSMKPIQFTFLLRVSKSQMMENGFKDALIEAIYELLLEYLTTNSHSISFPDLSLLCVVQIKQFVKKCANANYNRKMKQLLEKIEQNSKFIENERSKTTLNITDFKQIEGWEAQVKTKGTPLATFYDSWIKLHKVKKNKQLTNNEELGEYNLPTIKKKPAKVRNEGPVELFPSDSEDEDGGEEKKRKRGKRGGKNVNKKIKDESGPVEDEGGADIVEDLKMSDW